MIRLLNKYLFYLILISSGISGCADDPDCIIEGTDKIKLSFVDENGDANDIQLVRLTTVTNPNGFPEFTDSTLNTITLPLNASSDQVSFIFEQKTRIDSLSLSYRVSLKLLAPECGIHPEFDQLDTIFTTFKSLKIIEPIIHPDVKVNIEISL